MSAGCFAKVSGRVRKRGLPPLPMGCQKTTQEDSAVKTADGTFQCRKRRARGSLGFGTRRKWRLAQINGVRCLTMMKGMMGRLSNRKWRG